MVRGVRKQLAPLLSALSNSFASAQGGAAAYAVPALAGSTLPRSSYGKRTSVPLSEPLANVDIPKWTAPSAPELQTGTIAGAKAATISVPGPNSTVAVYVNAGSANETPAQAGAAKLLEYMAFQTTTNRSTFRVTRELEKYGAAFTAVAGRESISYTIESTRVNLPEVTELLMDCVLNQRLSDWEVRDMVERVQGDMEAAYRRPMIVLAELLHRAAFSGGLSKPLLPDAATLGRLSGQAVRDFYYTHFTPSNIVVAGAGADLRTLSHVAEPLLSSGGSGGVAGGRASDSSYTGGTLNMILPGSQPTVALAYEVKGGLSDAKAAATAAVLKALLNETREPLPKMRKAPSEGVLASLTPVVFLHKSTGLVGLAATCGSGDAPKALDALSAKMQGLTKGVNDTTLAAAKSLALGGYHSAITTKPGVVQDLGLQMLARGKFSVSEYTSALQGLSGSDLAKGAEALLKGAPTVVAAGALSDIPKFDGKRFS